MSVINKDYVIMFQLSFAFPNKNPEAENDDMGEAEVTDSDANGKFVELLQKAMNQVLEAHEVHGIEWEMMDAWLQESEDNELYLDDGDTSVIIPADDQEV